jgi:hypothetical protein
MGPSHRLHDRRLNDPHHPSARLPSIKPSHLEPAPSPHGLTLTTYRDDVRPRPVQPITPFHILIADIPPKTICADVSRLAND